MYIRTQEASQIFLHTEFLRQTSILTHEDVKHTNFLLIKAAAF